MPREYFTPNQIVAYNVCQLRKEKQWNQKRAGSELAKFLGVKWSRATFSAVERSVAGKRIKPFDADELVALCFTFDVTMSQLFRPAPRYVRVRPSIRGINPMDFKAQLFGRSEGMLGGIADSHELERK